MTVFVHSIVIICFKFLFVDLLGPTATLIMENSFDKKCDSYNWIDSLLSFLSLNNANLIKNDQKVNFSVCVINPLRINFPRKILKLVIIALETIQLLVLITSIKDEE